MNSILRVDNLGINFGGLKAVSDVSFDLVPSQITGLIGPNGAGKTTLFNLLTGMYFPTEGRIQLEGKDIASDSPEKRVQMGIARTFQNIRLFKRLSVIDNVKIGGHHLGKYSLLKGLFRTNEFWKEEQEFEEKSLEILDVFGMADLADQEAANLPYGKQRKLEICRALAMKPKLLLLDEPAAGMNPTETQELMETIQFVKEKFNLAILLIEHDMRLVMGICQNIIVLNYGKILANGLPEEVRQNPDVISAYLGGGEGEKHVAS